MNFTSSPGHQLWLGWGYQTVHLMLWDSLRTICVGRPTMQWNTMNLSNVGSHCHSNSFPSIIIEEAHQLVNRTGSVVTKSAHTYYYSRLHCLAWWLWKTTTEESGSSKVVMEDYYWGKLTHLSSWTHWPTGTQLYTHSWYSLVHLVRYLIKRD